jgi:hypothetical protein
VPTNATSQVDKAQACSSSRSSIGATRAMSKSSQEPDRHAVLECEIAIDRYPPPPGTVDDVLVVGADEPVLDPSNRS